jgi:hypothetical protein
MARIEKMNPRWQDLAANGNAKWGSGTASPENSLTQHGVIKILGIWRAPSASLGISPAGFRSAHARKTAQLRLRVHQSIELIRLSWRFAQEDMGRKRL